MLRITCRVVITMSDAFKSLWLEQDGDVPFLQHFYMHQCFCFFKFLFNLWRCSKLNCYIFCHNCTILSNFVHATYKYIHFNKFTNNTDIASGMFSHWHVPNSENQKVLSFPLVIMTLCWCSSVFDSKIQSFWHDLNAPLPSTWFLPQKANSILDYCRK